MTENVAFNEIYGKYKNLVLKAAHIYVDDLDTAEDIMQDTFLALYRDMRVKGFDREADYSNIKSWLYTTAKHLALNYRKKAARTVSADAMKDDDVLKEPISESLESEYFGMVSERTCLEIHDRIFTALMEKNPRWHEAIMMVGVLGMSAAEAAESLGINENAFYALVHRARNWIYKKFDVEYEELNKF